MFENRLQGKVFGSKREEEMEATENGLMRSFLICIPHQCYLGDKIQEGELGTKCDMHG